MGCSRSYAGVAAGLVAGVVLLAAPGPVAAQTLSVTHVTPAKASASGGTTIRLNGTGFTANTTVTIGGVPVAGLRFAGPTTLSFLAPAHAAGPATFVVTESTQPPVTRTLTYLVERRQSVAGARHLSMSHDGTWVAFDSRRALDGADTNGAADVYVLHKPTGRLTRVSVPTAPAVAIGGESINPSISASGRFVAFESRAANLVPNDSNGLLDVFLRDRDADGDGQFDVFRGVRTERISLGAGGAQATNGFSRRPAISADGRFVVFETAASLVAGARNETDLCVFDRLRRVTTRINLSSGRILGNRSASNPAISQTGRFVAFESPSSNLVPGDTNGHVDVFVHDRDLDGNGIMDETTAGAVATTLVSRATGGALGNDDSTEPSITGDGRYVVFASLATNLDAVRADTNRERDVFIHDRISGATRRLTVWPGGIEFVGPSRRPRISTDGTRLVFLTSGVNAASRVAPGLVAGLDDGKSTTGTIPGPTGPEPPPAVDPPDPASDDDPVVSGDGSDTGSTDVPTPGSGEPDPTAGVVGVDDEGPESPPFIAAIQPAGGPPAGGNVVDLIGTGLLFPDEVRWGGTTLTPGAGILASDASHVRLVVPAGPAGTVEVRVRNGEFESDAVPYVYGAISAPSISSFTPFTAGVTTGGTAMATISGAGFSAPTVRFGAASAPVVSSTPTSITVTVPDVLISGPVPIVVTNGDGAVAVSPLAFLYADSAAAPAITAVTPASGPVTGGTTVTILGAGFTAASQVTVGGVEATGVQLLSSAAMVATVPAGMAGPQPLRVATPPSPDATSTFSYVPLAAPVLACAGPDADADQIPDQWEEQFGLSSLDPSDGALDWDGDGRTNVQECQEATHPRGLYTRYLAEGATGAFFTTRVVVANPNVLPARVLLRFLTNLGTTVPQYVMVPAQSRRTLDLETIPGLEAVNVSGIIESDLEVVVDRTMRWDRASRAGAHAETSVPAPASTWYLAEGATHGFFDLFYLIENPSLTSVATVQIRFLRPAPAAPLVRSYVIAPNTRFTLAVDGIPELTATDVSAVVTSTNAVPIIVERAMYSSAAGVFAAGHDAAGVTAPSNSWFFAEGATGSFFDLFLLLANPNDTSADVLVRYLLPNGTTVDRTHVVGANSRLTINVATEGPELADAAVSMTVFSLHLVPIIAERSMWWPHGANWTEAHAAAGATSSGVSWAVADGETGTLPEDTATFILIANTSGDDATVSVRLLFEAGPPLQQTFTVRANSRFNVPIVTDEVAESPAVMRVPRGTRFSAVIRVIGQGRIVVERAMYWNANGQLWAAGSDLLATKLQ